jgi:hypothetical protein
VYTHCKTCLLNRAIAIKAPLEPIIVNEVFARIQLDLIDMRHIPSLSLSWILHVKDHFSKFSILYALYSKHAEGGV